MRAALVSTGEWIDFGPDSAAGLRRAARLLRKGVLCGVSLDEPVPTAYRASGAPISFCDLVAAGVMQRGRFPGWDADSFDTVYTVIDRVTFVDWYGHRWVYGTSETWEK